MISPACCREIAAELLAWEIEKGYYTVEGLPFAASLVQSIAQKHEAAEGLRRLESEAADAECLGKFPFDRSTGPL